MAGKTYRISDIVKKLGVSERSVFRYIHSGKLRATKIGYWRISETDLKKFIADQTNVRPRKRRQG